jgi:geranylgeranyl diphosphate synthase type I
MMQVSSDSLVALLSADVDRRLNALLDEVQRTMEAALELPSAASRRLTQAHFGWSRPTDGPRRLPGKGMRARLCLLTAASIGGDPAAAVRPAAAVELVHNFSLIYDDLMDGDTVRRGRPALWAEAGRDAAILTGLDMFAAAVAILAQPESPWVASVAELAATVQTMVAGQHDDMAMAAEPHQEDNSVQRWLAMAQAKTGSLFGCAMALGALAADAPPTVVSRLRQTGAKAGVAFQIIDDLIAVHGSETVTGKPRAAAPGANLYPVVRHPDGVERGRADAARHLDEAITSLRSVATDEEVFAYLAQLLRSGRDRNY